MFRNLRKTFYRLARNSRRRHVHNAAIQIETLTEDNLDSIEKNILLRQHKNNVPLIRTLLKDFNSHSSSKDVSLRDELEKLPNRTHPRLLNYGEEPRELMRYNPKPTQPQQLEKAKEFSEICKYMNLFRMDHLGNYTGRKSYYLNGYLAMLEQALVQYAVETLKRYGFNLVSVPDILPSHIIEACGMQTMGERTQVYKLDTGECLSGTSEMALAGLYADSVVDEKELPIKLAAVSRCYRAETSGLNEEKGIYRVHQFTKVEMFGICTETQSEELLESFKDFEISLFRNLELNFRLLDMPPCELGAAAYQKYDIETWMPGRQMWGEISSCSNCTDYQANRLNIRYRSKSNQIKIAHTVNGTATAIPRLLISLIETNQNGNSILIPTALQRYMKHTEIKKDKRLPDIKLVKFIKSS